MLTFTLISSILVLASQVSATAAPGPFMLSGLLPRQVTGLPTADIPQQCASQCTDLSNKANACTTSSDIPSCICTASFQQSFQTCVSCVVQTQDVEDAAQQAIQSFNDICQTDLGSSSGSPQPTSSGNTGSSGGVVTTGKKNSASNNVLSFFAVVLAGTVALAVTVA